MAIKLHTCGNPWVPGGHPCYKVKKALEQSGVPFEVVKNPTRRSKRDKIEAMTGQRLVPVIEFEDGTSLREESKDLVARIGRGELGTSAPAGG